MNKNRTVVILVVVILLFLVFNIGSCINAYNQNNARKKEMFQRLDLEEKMAKAVQDNAAAAERIKGLQKQLDEAKAGLEEAAKDLTEEKLVSKSLKEESQKVTKAKDALEEELKKVTATVKKAKK